VTQHPNTPSDRAEPVAASTTGAPTPPVVGHRRGQVVLGDPRPARPDHGEGTSPWRLVALVAGIVALGLWAGLSVIIVILAIVVMIFLHELGHFITARWAGMKVTEFFIGFGPRIWSFRRGETEYGVKAIPAGAYVRIIGMHNLDEVDPADEDRTYRQKSFGRRLSVAVAGSTMHFIIAIVCLFAVLTFSNVPGGRFLGSDVTTSPSWVIGSVVDDSAAQRAGLAEGDHIVSVDGEEASTFDALTEVVRARAGEAVDIVVEREGESLTVPATLGEREGDDGVEEGFLGVGPTLPAIDYGPVQAVGQTVDDFALVTWESVKAIGRFFSPAGLSDFASQVADGASPDGPTVNGSEGGATSSASNGEENRVISIYGATRLGAELTDEGVIQLLSFLVILNVFIGVFNLVPLLPLDGGHVAIATYERLRSRRGQPYHADVAKLLPLTYAVVLVLAFVGLMSLYLDIVNPLSLSE